VKKRKGIIVLAAVLMAESFLVAGVFTPEPHSGGDNAGYVALAHSLLENGSYRELWDPAEPPHTKYPPVFPLFLAGAILLGARSWAWLKVVPAFGTVLAVAFTFLWARERKGIVFGAVVALLVGLSESVVYYSQWILSDPVFLAVTMAALWAFQRSSGPPGESVSRREGHLWLVGGMILTAVAYLTRSAGLPLAAAVAVWLVSRKRWKALGLFSALWGIPAFLWWLRGRVLGGSQYVSEFWLRDPYQPQLGTVGPFDLFHRLAQNLEGYVTSIIPGGIVGDGVVFAVPVGLGLVLLALVGWIRSMREKVGVAEIFLPLYFGLILLWPLPWSGDRFSLPMLPLLFLYSGVALLWLLSSFSRRAQAGVLTVLALALALPAGIQWLGMSRAAAACRTSTERGSPMECLPPALAEYYALADWSGRNLPDDAVVTTRKPRTFFVMSGVKARSIPLLGGTDAFLSEVRAGGSRYVSMDGIDGLSAFYVYPVLMERLDLFCGIVEVGPSGRTGTGLLGLQEESPGSRESEPGVLVRCSGDMFRDQPRDLAAPREWEIPLLVWESG
jgi:hypothetical protein